MKFPPYGRNYVIIPRMRENRQIITLIGVISVNIIESALMGAVLGAALSAIVACVVWCANVGLFWGLPDSTNIAFSLGLGLLEGALAGAIMGLSECVVNRELCLSLQPLENPTR